ncbi:MAG: hypothetical protein GC166_04435 [Alphaproteobacteria bacterium]|nr:hypothetical protein [Alphaproteobacteria bacterium]
MATLITGHVSHEGHYTFGSLLHQARRGIPQGFATSPLIAMMKVAQLKWIAFAGVLLINYCDNFFLLGKTKDSVDAALNALRSAISELSGRQFLTKEIATTHISDGWEILGHFIKWENGELCVRPTDVKYNAFWHEIQMLDEKLVGYIAHKSNPTNVHFAKCILGNMILYGRSWTAAFSECNEPKENLECLYMFLKGPLAEVGLTADQAVQYADPNYRYRHCDMSGLSQANHAG